MHKFWNSFAVVDQISTLFEKWGNEFLTSIAPYWNAFFRSNPRWIAFGVVTGVFYAALVKKVVDGLVDWMQGR